MKEERKKQRILTFSARALGQNGTAGTYLLIEELSRRYNLLSCSPPPSSISVRTDFTFEKVFIDEKLGIDESSKSALVNFSPDIIIIFNHVGWWKFAKLARQLFPLSVIVFDAQTPLLVKEPSKRIKVQENGLKHQSCLDQIITFDLESAQTWLPKTRVPIYEYPLGIDNNFIRANRVEKKGIQRNEFLKYVYVGSLAPVREVRKLVEGFITYLQKTGSADKLDLFGIGEESDGIQKLIDKNKLNNQICLKGLVSSTSLSAQLSNYDFGLAWVPKATFNRSPSLKVLEYMASKIRVIATDTIPHSYLKDAGCNVLLHDDTADSLAKLLNEVKDKGPKKLIPEDDLSSNEKYITDKHTYNRIVANHISKTLAKIERRWHVLIQIRTLGQGKGGAERIATNLANKLSKKHTVTVSFNNGTPAYTLNENVRLWRYNNLSGIENYLINERPDIFFCFTFGRDVVSFLKLAKKVKVPFAYQECSNPKRIIENNWKKNGALVPKVIARWERETVAALADAIRLVLPGYELSFVKELRHKIHAFPNPCERYEKNDIGLTETLGIEGKKVILGVNSGKRNKNFLTTLDALAYLKMKGYDFVFIDIGKEFDSSEEYGSESLRRIKSLKLENNIILCGPQDNVQPFLSIAHVHVIASLSEGCPTVVLEAMQLGVPSVGFMEAEGVNKLITPNVDGVLVEDLDDGIELGKGIEKTLIQRDFYFNLVKNCQKKSSSFDSTEIYRRWEDLLFSTVERYVKRQGNILSLSDIELHSECSKDLLF